MRDQIEIVETDGEAAILGWCCLGLVHELGHWENRASLWCKQIKEVGEKFVLLSAEPNGYCEFIRYITFDEALAKLGEINNLEIMREVGGNVTLKELVKDE